MLLVEIARPHFKDSLPSPHVMVLSPKTNQKEGPSLPNLRNGYCFRTNAHAAVRDPAPLESGPQSCQNGTTTYVCRLGVCVWS